MSSFINNRKDGSVSVPKPNLAFSFSDPRKQHSSIAGNVNDRVIGRVPNKVTNSILAGVDTRSTGKRPISTPTVNQFVRVSNNDDHRIKINRSNLMKNAASTTGSKPTTPFIPGKTIPKKIIKTAKPELNKPSGPSQDELLDALLSQKSSHQEEATAEWYTDFDARAKKLVAREYAVDKVNVKTYPGVQISAFVCQECNPNKVLESISNLCQSKGHKVVSITAWKRYFMCSKCQRKEVTLGRTQISQFPAVACVFCHGVQWEACGAQGLPSTSTANAVMERKTRDERLVLSASEWTSRNDIDTIDSTRAGIDK